MMLLLLLSEEAVVVAKVPPTTKLAQRAATVLAVQLGQVELEAQPQALLAVLAVIIQH
jgi:hypothetical protein